MIILHDVLTVMWKESREIIAIYGSLKGGIFRYMLIIGIFGIYIPYNIGRGFAENPFYLLMYVWITMIMGVGTVVDSIAGERERHTLETLLASRLSDSTILFGKVLSTVLNGFGMNVILIVLGLTVVNVAFWNGQITLYPMEAFALVLLVSLLINIFFAALGVLVSLRAQTVRQGSEMLLVALIGIAAVPFILFFVIPNDLKKKVLDAIVSTSLTGLEVGAIAVLTIMCLITLYIAMLNFRRDKLILD
ncbi:MAG TPA: ABC transporter permease subunit [Methanocella sp.]|nr:ABC transporter permease subunit [Methanocella sp.]